MAEPAGITLEEVRDEGLFVQKGNQMLRQQGTPGAAASSVKAKSCGERRLGSVGSGATVIDRPQAKGDRSATFAGPKAKRNVGSRS